MYILNFKDGMSKMLDDRPLFINYNGVRRYSFSSGGESNLEWSPNAEIPHFVQLRAMG